MQLVPRLVLVFLLAALAACGGDDHHAQATPTTPPTATATETAMPTRTPPSTSTATITATPEPTGTPVLTIHDEFLTSSDQMMAWIAAVVAQGIRRPGYPADQWAEQFIRDQFTAFGLEDVQLDPVDVKRWLPTQWSLNVWSDATPQDVRSLPCFPLPYTAMAAGLEAPVVPFGDGT